MPPTPQHSLYSASKAVRLEARLSYDQKELIQHAADLLGRSLTDFIIAASQEAANKVIHDYEILMLNANASAQFAKLLLNPAKPNAALRKAAKKYRQFYGEKSNGKKLK